MDTDEDVIPTRNDFVLSEDDLDANWAWGNFGGLSVADAYRKFCERPWIYWEDFAWMGSRAFLYYFPVIERYILESRFEKDQGEVAAVDILAVSIRTRIEHSTLTPHFAGRVQRLVEHVRGHLPAYCADVAGQERLDVIWRELQEAISSIDSP